ncbi:hypothetical protein EYZ11_004730 [Aspergillus tanneri]|uniref:Cytochrome P450 n=1 Tax=Aspergillus tanneri TaxID=1220188 RepID=A0A4S3JM25_9EURO|nr:uncharacterized protein ATNIH1004_005926 [Aspergillus tanneri]KAA8647236.1 hypothetical protein ATNIH1004_005926 [Aspergillus tanneri]THC95777.1 hypothetical protein EYZ11_004730 [Aspergillus tanneri]
MLALKPTQWANVLAVIRKATRTWLDAPVPSNDYKLYIPLTCMIQSLTLRLVLATLFDMEEHALGIHDFPLMQLADAINETWVSSKKPGKVLPFEENQCLQDSLHEIFPDIDLMNPKMNPLNMILPGFETMWRVVFRMFIEIGFTSGQRNPQWKDILTAFARKPTRAQFIAKENDFQISAEYLVKEALRLYPPTRRIHRAFQTDNSIRRRYFAADIEGCHLDKVIWGSDALRFNPARWAKLTIFQEMAYMPFGGKPFECPAKQFFGPMAIGLLVGSVLSELGGSWTLKIGGEEVKR